jgi:serine/threonine protein kinase
MAALNVAQPVSRFAPQTRLGPYEIVAPLGAGGMGEVYRARDTRLDREVAIKLLPPALAADEQFRARFEREARSVSALNHPHICTLYDVGHAVLDGRTAHYLVFELIEGESLAQRLARGPLPLTEVLIYGGQVASALDAAHCAGIVHRDLKPGNVMITKSGAGSTGTPRAKLLDFGLAKTGERGAIESLSTVQIVNGPLTEQGTILGTFQYMAPEQLEGTNADATGLLTPGSWLCRCGPPPRSARARPRPCFRRASPPPTRVDSFVLRLMASAFWSWRRWPATRSRRRLSS